MTLGSWLALAARETRGSAGRLTFFIACLAVGVAAVVAVAELARALDDGIQARARQLLAADLAVTSRRPIDPLAAAAAAALPGARLAEVRELASVVSAPARDDAAVAAAGSSLLCELKAVQPGYPFYGAVVTEPPRPPAELLADGEVLVGPELPRRLGLGIGDSLRIGSADYRIAGLILSEPDRLEIGLTLGPRVLMSLAGLERSGLVGLGSRVRYRLLVRLPDGADETAVTAAAATVRTALPDPEYARLETYRDAQPALRASLRRVALGVGVAVLFALRPLADVVRVPPVRVLRHDAEPLPMRRRVAASLWTATALGIATIAAVQGGSALRGVEFTLSIAAVVAALAAGAWAVMLAAGRTPRERGAVSLRHGLAALARPGAGTLGAVVALGLGVVTVLGMHLVERQLSAQLDADLPAAAPTAFLVDIQPEQWHGVRQALADAGAEDVESVEVVVARLRAISGVPVADLLAAEGADDRNRRRWVFTREQRLATMQTLPEDNVIVDGALWSEPDRPEVSIERDFAADLGVGIGDTLQLDVQGVPLELDATSIRTVDWSRFTINFFLVVEPGVLDRAPRFRIAAARLPESTEGTLQDRLAAAFPNVTMLRLREVLAKVVSVLRQVGFGVRLLGGFTVLAGIAILGGAIAAQAVRRGREVALYKTLGMTRAQVATVLAVEYALVGLVAGAIGIAGGVVLAWVVVRFGMEIAWSWAPAAPAVALLLTVVLSVAAGLAASTRALAVRPLTVLRQSE